MQEDIFKVYVAYDQMVLIYPPALVFSKLLQ